MGIGGKRRERQTVCLSKELQKTGFILIVFGLVTFCAFFLPIKAWILLLAIVLIYCGFRLNRLFK